MNFIQRSHWLTLGLSDEDMVKPKIVIVNSSSEIAVFFSHLDEISKDAIRAAGGVAFEVRTVAPSDAFMGTGHGGYIQSSRDLVDFLPGYPLKSWRNSRQNICRK